MKYYQVLPKFYGTRVLKYSTRRGVYIDRELIARELYTPGELKRLLRGATLEKIAEGVQVFQEVTIPKTKTYWMFGARFPFHDLQEGGAENALY